MNLKNRKDQQLKQLLVHRDKIVLFVGLVTCVCDILYRHLRTAIVCINVQGSHCIHDMYFTYMTHDKCY